MTRGEAIEKLRVGNGRERLEAARFLAETPTLTPDERQELAGVLAQETVPWVRTALSRAIRVGDFRTIEDPSEVDVDLRSIREDVSSAAVHEATDRILHELSPTVGRALLSAEREIDNYGSSRTRHELERLSVLVSAIRELSQATSIPMIDEYDLSKQITELVKTEEESAGCPIRASGQSPFMVFADRGFLEIAIQNGLRNAVEATQSVSPKTPSPITVNWGIGDREFWVVIIDRGPGPPPAADDLFALGATTKSNHSGLGLATALRALRGLGGDVSLVRNELGGATYCLRWPERK
jgi:signal transduction histidine kinase